MPWQPSGVEYPDVELLLCDYLRTRLLDASDPAFVGNRVPSPRVPRMVIVRRDGGQVRNLRDQARVSIRVWESTEKSAMDLARRVSSWLLAAADGAPVLSVEHQSGPNRVPDESEAALVYLVFTVSTRGEVPA